MGVINKRIFVFFCLSIMYRENYLIYSELVLCENFENN